MVGGGKTGGLMVWKVGAFFDGPVVSDGEGGEEKRHETKRTALEGGSSAPPASDPISNVEHPPASGPKSGVEDQLSCSIKGYYPFPDNPGLLSPLAWLFRYVID